MKEFENLVEQVHVHRNQVGPEDLVPLLAAAPGEQPLLHTRAHSIRLKYLGNEVHLRGIIEFSNHCRCHCLYCGLRSANRFLTRYRMNPGEIMDIARRAAQMGLRTLVLQSGEDGGYDHSLLASIIARIKVELDVAVTLSLGVRTFEEYRSWREAGASRYLLKHETADPELFARLRPGTSLTGRLAALKALKSLGYQTGSGCMVGLPGQSLLSLARDLILMRDLKVEMAGIGPFIPHDRTPLAGAATGTVDLTLNTIAAARILMPRIHLPATTAISSIHPEGRRLALMCGANVVMPNVTPAGYRPHYSIYPGKLCLHEDPPSILDGIKKLIEDLGLRVATDYGHGAIYL